jgi:hypothetical protein
MSLYDDFATLDLKDYNEGRIGPPRINWWNDAGKFYSTAVGWREALEEPWRPTNRFEGEDGYEALQLDLAVIHVRKRPFIKNSDGKREYLSEWRDGTQYHSEYLVMINGIEEPAVFSVHGMAGRAMADIKKLFEATVLRAARKAAPKGVKIPLWACWMPIGMNKDANGRAIRTRTGHGSNPVVLPALLLPSDDDAACFKQLYVGKDILQWGTELYHEYQPWAKYEDEQPEVQAIEVPSKPDELDAQSDEAVEADLPF